MQGKLCAWHTVKFSHMSFCLVPKILYSIGMVFTLGEQLRVIDSVVFSSYKSIGSDLKLVVSAAACAITKALLGVVAHASSLNRLPGSVRLSSSWMFINRLVLWPSG